MSEKQHPKHESGLEPLDVSAETRRNQEHLEKAGPEAELPKAEIHELRSIVEGKAISSKEITVGEHEQPKSDHIYGTPKELKAEAYERSLDRIRVRLSAPGRVFSRFVHQPVIDTVSEGMSKTVARPSGILGGGICAFLGSCFLLYLTKRYGFEYNYFVFFLLLGVGFLLGMIVELIVQAVARARR